MSTAQKLAAEGESITLNNGQIIIFKYGMKSLMRLEERFGGLANIPDGRDMSAPMIGPLMDLMSCGLLGQHDGQGVPLTADSLADLIDPEHFMSVAAIAGAALEQAFPTSAAPAATDADQSSGSLGTTGTTQPPSSSDAAPTSSGT